MGIAMVALMCIVGAAWALTYEHGRLRHLLSAELPFQCVLRLWDTYFARHADADLHVFVCLAILNLCKETLLECEYCELKVRLLCSNVRACGSQTSLRRHRCSNCPIWTSIICSR